MENFNYSSITYHPKPRPQADKVLAYLVNPVTVINAECIMRVLCTNAVNISSGYAMCGDQVNAAQAVLITWAGRSIHVWKGQYLVNVNGLISTMGYHEFHQLYS